MVEGKESQKEGKKIDEITQKEEPGKVEEAKGAINVIGTKTAETSEQKDDKEKSFFEREIEKYRAFLKRSWDSAYKRYGLSLFHSLSVEERVKIMEELGFEPIDAKDYYNKAVLAIQENDLKKAEKYLDLALKEDPQHPESLFNMALLFEKTDRKAQSLNYWEKYIELIDNEVEIKMIADHLEETV